MSGSDKRKPPPASPKPSQRREVPPAKANPRLAQQTRKLLGKHYAAKYRVG